MNPVHHIWLDGRWKPYPVMMPIFKPVEFTEDPPEFDDVTFGGTVVWIGPAAPYPSKASIPEPRQAITMVPHIDLQYPQWKSFYASKVTRGCAWMYEMGPEIDGWHIVIWKVWDK